MWRASRTRSNSEFFRRPPVGRPFVCLGGRMKKTLKALGKAACYAFYFVLMQNLVTLIVTAGDLVRFLQRYEALWNSNPLGVLELFMARMEEQIASLSLTSATGAARTLASASSTGSSPVSR